MLHYIVIWMHIHVCKQWLEVMVYKTYVELVGRLLSAIVEEK